MFIPNDGIDKIEAENIDAVKSNASLRLDALNKISPIATKQ